MYRPESGIAEEFIDDQEIKDTLAYADANKDNKELILSIICLLYTSPSPRDS